jgi:hypothetical protein
MTMKRLQFAVTALLAVTVLSAIAARVVRSAAAPKPAAQPAFDSVSMPVNASSHYWHEVLTSPMPGVLQISASGTVQNPYRDDQAAFWFSVSIFNAESDSTLPIWEHHFDHNPYMKGATKTRAAQLALVDYQIPVQFAPGSYYAVVKAWEDAGTSMKNAEGVNERISDIHMWVASTSETVTVH